MKKLMIAAAIVCVAAFSNAANVAWGFASADTVAPDGNYFGEGAYADATAFLFKGAVTMGESGWNVGTATILATANMDPTYYNWGATDTSSTAGMLTADVAAGDTVTLVLLDGVVGNSIDAFTSYEGNYIIGSKNTLASDSIPGVTPVAYLSALDSTVYGASDWTATPQPGPTPPGPTPIPEPTSGLLMLLGVAGLALKRKFA